MLDLLKKYVLIVVLLTAIASLWAPLAVVPAVVTIIFSAHYLHKQGEFWKSLFILASFLITLVVMFALVSVGLGTWEKAVLPVLGTAIGTTTIVLILLTNGIIHTARRRKIRH